MGIDNMFYDKWLIRKLTKILVRIKCKSDCKGCGIKERCKPVDITIRALLSIFDEITTYLYRIQGESMEPFFFERDLVMIVPPGNIKFDQLKPGDIISFWRRGKIVWDGDDCDLKYPMGHPFVIHRISRMKKGKHKTLYKTKGDNNEKEDNDIIDKSDITGVVVAKVIFKDHRQIIQYFNEDYVPDEIKEFCPTCHKLRE